MQMSPVQLMTCEILNHGIFHEILILEKCALLLSTVPVHAIHLKLTIFFTEQVP